MCWHSIAHLWGLLSYRASETHLKLKSHEISFIHNIHISYQIVLQFCTEHGSITAVLCAKLQNNLIIDMDVIEEQDFVDFGFKKILRRIYSVL